MGIPGGEITGAEPQRADAKRNRDAVLDAAADLLAKRPNASMQEIAEASGLGRTTIYRHFQQREDLIAALFNRVLEEARELFADQMSREASIREVLIGLGPGLVSIGERYRFFEMNRQLRSELVNNRAASDREPFRDLLEEAKRRGDARANVPADWVIAMLRGLAALAAEEIEAGRLTVDQAGVLVGQTLAATFCLPEKA